MLTYCSTTRIVVTTIFYCMIVVTTIMIVVTTTDTYYDNDIAMTTYCIDEFYLKVFGIRQKVNNFCML